MADISPCPLPPDALLRRYAGQGFTDCFTVTVAQTVPLTHFVEAFYTTRLFRLERWLLATAVSRPSTDAQVRELATGQCKDFAAWSVEDRSDNQLLLADLHGRTRSWLMTEPTPSGTRLYFGSAVVPNERAGGPAKMGKIFHALLGFHTLYSRLLLAAACRRLVRN